MVVNTQLKLTFDVDIVYGKAKRVHYKTPLYTKYYTNDISSDGIVYDDSKWSQMHQVYKAVANWVVISYGKEPEHFDIEGLRIWNDYYKADTYYYKNQRFKGQEFRCRMGEIIGTEKLNIDERLSIHNCFIELMRAGKTIKEAVQLCLKQRVK